MRIAYLDCASGISGDMTLGALVDCGVPLADIAAAVDSMGLPGCRLVAREVKKNGFRATQISVEYEPEHVHRHLSHIVALIERGRLNPRPKELALRIFRRLAEAEAKVHGTTVEKVHFHEVGAVDSIADIVGAAVGFDLLGAERIVASPVPTGQGKIKTAHGELGVPAPATAELLVGVPLAPSAISAELTTPTGAAILAVLAESFGPMPAMTIGRIGYGAGQRDLAEQPNVLRLVVGEAASPQRQDELWMLETNLDDISGELVGYCTSRLWSAGALDVYATSVQMKKNRPGVVLSVLCPADRIADVEGVLFSETTTLGVRRWPVSRHILERRAHVVETPLGPVEGKLAWSANVAPRFAPEFESCRQVAELRQVPLRAVYEAAVRAFQAAGSSGSPPGKPVVTE